MRYFESSKQKYLLREVNGATVVRRWWNGFSAILDLSNEEAVAWFKNQLDYLRHSYGIDGFKFDAGDAVYYRDHDQTKKAA